MIRLKFITILDTNFIELQMEDNNQILEEIGKGIEFLVKFLCINLKNFFI